MPQTVIVCRDMRAIPSCSVLNPRVSFPLLEKTADFVISTFKNKINVLTFLHVISVSIPRPAVKPCFPSPCGANAICREQNGAGACVCLPEYYGNPYEGCRPECVINPDCASNKACMSSKCRDPCPGTCGQNANCQVVNHLPACTCYPGYTGDPFRYCNPIPPKRKLHFRCMK